MTAAPQHVAIYLGHLAAEGKSLATINQARVAISHAHAAEGVSQNENPARHPVVAEMIKGWRNQAPAPAQVEALTAQPWPGSGRQPACPGAAVGEPWNPRRRHRPEAPST